MINDSNNTDSETSDYTDRRADNIVSFIANDVLNTYGVHARQKITHGTVVCSILTSVLTIETYLHPLHDFVQKIKICICVESSKVWLIYKMKVHQGVMKQIMFVDKIKIHDVFESQNY